MGLVLPCPVVSGPIWKTGGLIDGSLLSHVLVEEPAHTMDNDDNSYIVGLGATRNLCGEGALLLRDRCDDRRSSVYESLRVARVTRKDGIRAALGAQRCYLDFKLRST